MEGSLLVGDFLCVSKAHYGIRTPMTIAMIPLLHNRVPGLNMESYWEKPSLSYFRLPALQKIRRNDPVVFNYPEGDSVFILPGRTYSIYDIRRMGLDDNPQFEEPVTRPMDKMDHYIKRCIAIPGDTLEIRDKQAYINGETAETPKYLQYSYILQTRGTPLNERRLKEWGINIDDAQPPVYNLSEEHLEQIRSLGNVEITPVVPSERPLFPYDQANFSHWTVDNYGPIWVPKRGITIDLDMSNIALYRRLITTYEGNDLEIDNGEIKINGNQVSSYTFQMDYYWMMGDNRHNSEDSRVWGFVPEDHIVGKPLFIWFSTRDGSIQNGINWKRLFTGANKK
jgi:signal peptidase I